MTMPRMTIDESFRLLESQLKPEKARGLELTVEYHIRDEETESVWSVVVSDGEFDVSQSALAEPDVTLWIERADWTRSVSGVLDRFLWCDMKLSGLPVRPAGFDPGEGSILGELEFGWRSGESEEEEQVVARYEECERQLRDLGLLGQESPSLQQGLYPGVAWMVESHGLATRWWRVFFGLGVREARRDWLYLTTLAFLQVAGLACLAVAFPLISVRPWMTLTAPVLLLGGSLLFLWAHHLFAGRIRELMLRMPGFCEYAVRKGLVRRLDTHPATEALHLALMVALAALGLVVAVLIYLLRLFL